MRFARNNSVLIVLILFFTLRSASCGGGNDVQNLSVADGLRLTWDAPLSYADSSPLDPWEELDVYELYINDTGIFHRNDSPVAYISATDMDGFPVTTFDLGCLDYPFALGRTYFISMRSVTKMGSRSEYSPVFPFTIPIFIVES